jgi:phosphoribosylformylglycinamidine cyclo-ligase
MTPHSEDPLTYGAAGVDTDAAASGLAGLLGSIRQTLEYRKGMGEPLLPIGFFASVVQLTERLSLAISTDGVGSKTVLAQLVGRYDAIGVDCVAVNVNDIICTGAEPLGIVDYISCQAPHADLLEQLGQGLKQGASRARIAVVGGELSQHPDTLIGPRAGYAFDMAGTAYGVLDNRSPIIGSAIRPGDVVLGLPSDGIHCNGLTLARRVLLGQDGRGVDRYLDQCGRTVGEELLRPTHIYAPEVAALLRSDVEVKGLAHISGDGLLNLTRFHADVGYRITTLPPTPPVFEAIQEQGNVATEEMYRVFNMGIGFCAVVSATQADAAMAAIATAGGTAQVIGDVVQGPQRHVYIEQQHLVGVGSHFTQQTT